MLEILIKLKVQLSGSRPLGIETCQGDSLDTINFSIVMKSFSLLFYITISSQKFQSELKNQSAKVKI